MRPERRPSQLDRITDPITRKGADIFVDASRRAAASVSGQALDMTQQLRAAGDVIDPIVYGVNVLRDPVAIDALAEIATAAHRGLRPIEPTDVIPSVASGFSLADRLIMLDDREIEDLRNRQKILRRHMSETVGIIERFHVLPVVFDAVNRKLVERGSSFRLTEETHVNDAITMLRLANIEML